MTDLDVLVIGAGISGIGAGVRFRQMVPDQRFEIWESREAIGGTWDLFRYPGIRSDSDMFTLGYPFRPWVGAKTITDGPSILRYIQETAEEHHIGDQIRFGRRVTAADWSSAEARWTVTAEVGPDRDATVVTCKFLYLCTGYYNYTNGYEVDFPGRDRFPGPVIHPQHWPDDLDYTDQRVVVIGSGATAVTLVPAMTDRAAHVTMLQRSPSYVVSRPAGDPLADRLRRVLPGKLAYRLIRAKNITLATAAYHFLRRAPERASRFLRDAAAKQLPASVPVDPHFTPRYKPWDQRLCLVPNGDLFQAIRDGKASIVTDTVETFTETGVTLASGTELPADLIITATGLAIAIYGQIKMTVDGTPVVAGERMVYKGLMLDGVPNMAWCVGYTNNSWTLRADIANRYVAALLRHMKRHGYTTAAPDASVSPPGKPRPILDLTSGYIQRAAAVMPKQGGTRPWQMRQNYLYDLATMRLGRIDDGVLAFTRSGS